MVVMQATLLRELVSLIVPPVCAACREPQPGGEAICAGCTGRLALLGDPRCPRCGAPVSGAGEAPAAGTASRPPAGRPSQARPSQACRECAGRELGFARAWSPFAYAGVARRVVGALKHGGSPELAAAMAHEIGERAPPGLLAGEVVPVPAHGRRRRRHGFNQARALAGAVARARSLPLRDVLRRTAASPQVGRERRARLLGARGSVRLRGDPPPVALLVDDVYTTGATLDACGRALIEGGGRLVVAVTFARTVRERPIGPRGH